MQFNYQTIMKGVERAYAYVRAKLQSWDEGAYIDRWTIVHACSGVTLGAFAALFSINFFIVLFGVTLVALLWEGWELSQNIEETFENRSVDIAVAVITATITYLCIVFLFESRFVRILITMTALLITGYLAQQGWHMWLQKRA